jgi:hypothetical protein
MELLACWRIWIWNELFNLLEDLFPDLLVKRLQIFQASRVVRKATTL